MADLTLLPDSSEFDGPGHGHSHFHGRSIFTGTGTKNVTIHDDWEKFELCLTVFHPIVEKDQQMMVRGNIPELGSWKKSYAMKKVKKDFRWLFNKYGEAAKPYELSVMVSNTQ